MWSQCTPRLGRHCFDVPVNPTLYNVSISSPTRLKSNKERGVAERRRQEFRSLTPTTKIRLTSSSAASLSIAPEVISSPSWLKLARDALHLEGYRVIAGYMSPVSDAYKKPGLVSGDHRLLMCNLACESSDFIMVDPWEANQASYQRSLTILKRIESFFLNKAHIPKESLKVMLVCGSDLIQSFSIPGFWIREQVRIICRDYGVVCIRREGQDVKKIINDDEILRENRDNVKLVDEQIPNHISSTRLRECISRGLSIKYLTSDGVIQYIKEHHLYLNQNEVRVLE